MFGDGCIGGRRRDTRGHDERRQCRLLGQCIEEGRERLFQGPHKGFVIGRLKRICDVHDKLATSIALGPAFQ